MESNAPFDNPEHCLDNRHSEKPKATGGVITSGQAYRIHEHSREYEIVIGLRATYSLTRWNELTQEQQSLFIYPSIT